MPENIERPGHKDTGQRKGMGRRRHRGGGGSSPAQDTVSWPQHSPSQFLTPNNIPALIHAGGLCPKGRGDPSQEMGSGTVLQLQQPHGFPASVSLPEAELLHSAHRELSGQRLYSRQYIHALGTYRRAPRRSLRSGFPLSSGSARLAGHAKKASSHQLGAALPAVKRCQGHGANPAVREQQICALEAHVPRTRGEMRQMLPAESSRRVTSLSRSDPGTS